jgi:hypothetical protein
MSKLHKSRSLTNCSHTNATQSIVIITLHTLSRYIHCILTNSFLYHSCNLKYSYIHVILYNVCIQLFDSIIMPHFIITVLFYCMIHGSYKTIHIMHTGMATQKQFCTWYNTLTCYWRNSDAIHTLVWPTLTSNCRLAKYLSIDTTCGILVYNSINIMTHIYPYPYHYVSISIGPGLFWTDIYLTKAVITRWKAFWCQRCIGWDI